MTIFLLIRFAIPSDTLTWLHHCYAFLRRASLHHIFENDACKWWSCRQFYCILLNSSIYVYTIGISSYYIDCKVKNESMNLHLFYTLGNLLIEYMIMSACDAGLSLFFSILKKIDRPFLYQTLEYYHLLFSIKIIQLVKLN